MTHVVETCRVRVVIQGQQQYLLSSVETIAKHLFLIGISQYQAQNEFKGQVPTSLENNTWQDILHTIFINTLEPLSGNLGIL